MEENKKRIEEEKRLFREQKEREKAANPPSSFAAVTGDGWR